MGVYLHIAELRNLGTTDAPKGSFQFLPLAKLPVHERVAWDQMNFMALEDFIAPFEREDVPVALTLVMQPRLREVMAIAGFVNKPKRAGVVQVARPADGLITRVFHLNKNCVYFAQASVSDAARTYAFTPRMLRAFDAVDLKAGASHTTINAVNAGPYVWMRYGAVPNIMKMFASAARVQWPAFLNAALNNNLEYDGSVGAWLRSLNEDSSHKMFRAMFDKNAMKLTQNTLKAVLLGNLQFLQEDNFRFTRGSGQTTYYADPMDLGLTFHTADRDFRTHFQTQIEQSIAQAPRKTFRQRLGL